MEQKNIWGIIIAIFALLVIGGIILVAMQRGGVQDVNAPDTVVAPGVNTIKSDG